MPLLQPTWISFTNCWRPDWEIQRDPGHIVPIRIGESARTMQISRECLANGHIRSRYSIPHSARRHSSTPVHPHERSHC